MPVRQADLVKRWGCSRAWVSKLCGRGMPLDSVEAAEEWRRAHAAVGVGHRTAGAADPATARGQLASLPPPVLAATPHDVDPESVVHRLRSAELGAYQQLDEALKRASAATAPAERGEWLALVPGLQRTHAQAARNRLDGEKQLAKYRAQTGRMVALDYAQGLIASKFAPIDAGLRNLAKILSHRANPTDPALAEREIQTGVNAILRQLAA